MGEYPDPLADMCKKVDDDADKIMLRLYTEAKFVGVSVPEYLELRAKIEKDYHG